jgi:hypothetical protein
VEPVSDNRFDPNFDASLLLDIAHEQSLVHVADVALDHLSIAVLKAVADRFDGIAAAMRHILHRFPTGPWTLETGRVSSRQARNQTCPYY